MRDCRGPQVAARVDVPALAPSASPRAYAIATSRDGRFNIVIHYGYPYANLEKGERYAALRLRVTVPLPPEVKGRTLVVARADPKTIREDPPRRIEGDRIDLVIDLPAQSAVSLTVGP